MLRCIHEFAITNASKSDKLLVLLLTYVVPNWKPLFISVLFHIENRAQQVQQLRRGSHTLLSRKQTIQQIMHWQELMILSTGQERYAVCFILSTNLAKADTEKGKVHAGVSALHSHPRCGSSFSTYLSCFATELGRHTQIFQD